MNDETQQTDAGRLEKEEIEDLGTVTLARGGHVIHCLTVIGQIEGHSEAPQGQKTTKYEHVIPQLVAAQEDPRIEGLLVLLNTVGGDVEAGLALAELIASVSKPSATLVLGGGHSIGIPLAVSARRSFIVPTATMTVHPVRHSGAPPTVFSSTSRPSMRGSSCAATSCGMTCSYFVVFWPCGASEWPSIWPMTVRQWITCSPRASVTVPRSSISSFSSRRASVSCVSSFICFPPAFSVSIPQPVPGYADPLQQKSGNIS